MTSPYSKWSLKMRFRCAGAQCFNVLIFMWFKTWCEALSSRSPGAARLPKCPNANFWFSPSFWWLWDRFWIPDDVPRYEIEYLAKAVISKESCGHIRIHCGEAWACVLLESSDFFENMMITLIKVEYIQRHPGDYTSIVRQILCKRLQFWSVWMAAVFLLAELHVVFSSRARLAFCVLAVAFSRMCVVWFRCSLCWRSWCWIWFHKVP